MKDMFCDKLVAYLDGDLSEVERGELERHLEKCPGCRAELDILKSVLALTEADTPPRFDGVTWNVPTRSRVVRKRWVWVPVLAGAAAAVLLFVFGGDRLQSVASEGCDDWVVVAEDSVSVDEGAELAMMLLTSDEELVQGLENYDENMPADIYTEISELSDEEEARLVDLLEEMTAELGKDV